MVLPRATLALAVSSVLMMFAADAVPATSPHASDTTTSSKGLASSDPSDPSDLAGIYEPELAAAARRLAATRDRPEGVASLFAVASLYDELPPGRVERVLRQTVVDAPGVDPLVAAQASYLLARMEDDRGEVAAADQRRLALGLVTQFSVVGPFGEGRSTFSQVFPPERDPGAAHSPPIAWRAGGDAVRQGALYLDALLRPDSQTAAYVKTFIRGPRAGLAALRLGSAGPVKVWVNGALVHARDVVRNAALDQDAFGVRLRQGWNEVLIKTVVTDGPWRLFVRLTDPAGRPLPFVAQGDPPPGAGRPAVPGVRRAPVLPVRSLVEALRTRAQRLAKDRTASAASATAWLDLGRFLAWNQPGDREAREDAAALEASVARRATTTALLRLAESARDEDERRRTLERARQIADKDSTAKDNVKDDANDSGAGLAARALVAARLGDVARDQHRDAVALRGWREALRLDPGCWPAALALSDEEQSAGLPFLALGRLTALPASIREIPRVKRQLVRLLDSLDRHAEADRLLGQLAGVRRLDIDIAHELARRARTRSDAPGAIALLRGAAAARPDLPSLTVDLALALEGAAKGAEARTVLEALAARLPDDPATQAQLGKLLHRQGEREAALVRLRRALALRPQDPDLRRYTDRVALDREHADGSPGEDLARRYAADVAAMVQPTKPAAPAAPAATLPPASADPAIVWLDRRVVRVHRNGLAETFAQRVVEVKTDRGAEDNKQFYVRYTPGVEEVEIREARIFRRGADGQVQVLDAGERDDEDLSEPWYGLYYDNRAEVVRFEGLRAGDVMEVQYLVDDVSVKNQMADYFGDLQFIAEEIPKRQWDYTLISPPDRTFYTNTPRVAGLQQQSSQEAESAGGERVLRFAARDVAKTSGEPAMPGYTEVSPYLHVSTYASWHDVGVWYWRLVDEQMVPDDTIRAAARSVLARGMTDVEKVRAIHGLVVTGTRYVGLEFGIHGFQPYKVTQVLARKFGDCKDKATLLVALLREAGIEAELVLLRTRRGGRIEPVPASLAIFDHAIVYVPKLDVYLDGTAEFSGTGELPSQDQGVTVLRVGPRGAVLTETPVLSSANNRAVRRWSATLSATGEARVTESLVITGQAAPEWREHYQTAGERLDRYAKVWSGRYPGATLLSVEMPGIEDRNQPVTVDAVASVPRLGQTVSRGRDGEPQEIDLSVTVRDADFSRTYARLSERKEDLIIAYPWQHDEELVFHLPPHWEVASAPAARATTSAFGTFHLEITAERAGEVRVRSMLDVTRHRISPDDYPQFRAFLNEIDATLAGRITIRKVAP
jgi:transglutaminase-like putative cysteine protease/tetratricopeptide (TPR) repeat protein